MLKQITIIVSFMTILLTGSIFAEDIQTNEKQVNMKKEEVSTDTIDIIMHTNKGDIALELYKDKAPITVNNFITYINEDFFDGLIFHRVISTFMIQGGGFTPQGVQKNATHDPIKNEATNGLKNARGTIAMARTGRPHSATCQFFINVKDNPALNHKNKGRGYGYAVFGKVTDGLEVVDQIKEVATGVNASTRMQDWPKEDIIIEEIEIKQ